jgi:pyruvate dehydrogenase E2 component (dihydrolipoamide acetyltransferase)
MRALLAVVLLAAACGRDDEPRVATTPAGAPAPSPAPAAAPASASASDPASASTPPTPPAAPASDVGGFHLDDPTVDNPPADAAADPPRPAEHKGKPVELLLRSSPPGAIAAIDGQTIGPTPVLWSGRGDGRAIDFTFVLPGYSTARYRFVPIQNGVVHASLERLKLEDADAGP